MPELEDDPDEYEVEEVRDKEVIRGQVRYLVKWTGWPSEYNQWVNEADMANAQGKIRSFEKAKSKKARKVEGVAIGTANSLKERSEHWELLLFFL